MFATLVESLPIAQCIVCSIVFIYPDFAGSVLGHSVGSQFIKIFSPETILNARTAEGVIQFCQETITASTTELLTTIFVDELIPCGSQSVPKLINIYQDTWCAPLERLLAVRALGHFSDYAAVTALSEIVQSEETVFRETSLDFSESLIQIVNDQQDRALPYWVATVLGQANTGAFMNIPSLIRDLQDPAQMVRISAAYSLGLMGGRAQSAVPDLIGLLSDPDPYIRIAAVNALGGIGAEAQLAIPNLISILENQALENADIGDGPSLAVAYALGIIGLDSLPCLLKLLEVDNENLRHWVSIAIGNIGSAAIPSLAQALQSYNIPLRRGVVRSLEWMETAEVIPFLLSVLKDSDEGVRQEAASAFVRLSADNDEATKSAMQLVVRDLLPTLQDDNVAVRRSVAWALGNIQLDSQDAAGSLVQALSDNDGEVRYGAARALAQSQLAASDAIPILLEIATTNTFQNDFQNRSFTWELSKYGAVAVPHIIEALESTPVLENQATEELIFTLKQIGSDASAAVPILLRILQTPETELTQQAIEALGTIGPAAKPAIPEIILHLQSENENLWVRRAAAKALGQISSGTEVISALTEAFQSEPDHWNKRDYLAALGNIGLDAAVSLPVLLATLQAEESDHYVSAYAEAFSKIYRNNLSALVALLENDSPQVRQAGVIALRHIGADALPELITALNHEQADVRSEIANSIAHIGQDATSSVPSLVDRLSDPSPIVRTQAAYALGAIGSLAKAAVSVLENQLEDQDWLVRIAAAYALWQIDEQKIGLPTLEAALDVNEEIRSVAAYLLGQIGEPEVVPLLIKALSYTDHSYGVTLLALIGWDSNLSDDATVPSLIAALQNENYAVRRGAANTLGWNMSSLAVPALLEYLKEERAALRQLLPELITQVEAGQPISTAVLERYPALRWPEPDEAPLLAIHEVTQLTFLRELSHDQDQLNHFIFSSAEPAAGDIQLIIYGSGAGSPVSFLDSLQRVVARVRGQ